MPASAATPVALELGRAIDALLAATPEPPDADSDPGEIVEQAGRMLAARAPLCQAVEALVERERAVPPSHAAPYAALVERNARWSACLQHARHSLSLRLGSSRRLRHAY